MAEMADFKTSLKPTAPALSKRYTKSPRVESQHSSIPAASSTEPLDLPSSWRSCVHPEGALYFHRNSQLNVVTGENLWSVAASSHIYYWSEEVIKMFGEVGVPLSDSYELYLEFDEDDLSCGYYIADHSKRCIFWLEPVSTEDVGMNPAFSLEHLRYALEESYWSHVEFYPSHCGISTNDVVNTLLNTLTHAQGAGSYKSRERISTKAEQVDHRARYPNHQFNGAGNVSAYRNRTRHLEEAKRNLDVFEKAYHRADRDVRDREARSEREKRVLRDEIRRLKFASLKVAKEIEALEKPAAKMVGGAGPISLLSSVTEGGRRIELAEGFPRDTIRDSSTPAYDFMELFEGAIVDHVTTRCQDQGQLLEEAQRDLEAFKKAYYNAEREIQDLGERFAWEKQVLNDEIRRLREHELHCREGRFESTIVYNVTQCQCQGRLLDEAKRDLDALKKAQYKAECDMRHLEERFEREMGSANSEIRHLRAIVAHGKRTVDQQIPSAAPADARRYAAVWEGTKTA